MTFDYVRLGERIRLYRNLANISQESLAETAGITRNHLSYIENGKRLPSLDTVIEIINALNITPNMLLSDAYSEIDGLIAVLTNKSPQITTVVIENAKYLTALLEQSTADN